MKSDGISQLFSVSGDSYELQSDDSLLVSNADLGDGVVGQTARYRKVDGSYQFAEIVQEYAVISASDVALHPLKRYLFTVKSSQITSVICWLIRMGFIFCFKETWVPLQVTR